MAAAEDSRAAIESLASVALTIQVIAMVLLSIGTIALYELYSLSNDVCAATSSCNGVAILSVLALPLLSLGFGAVLTALSIVYIRTPLRAGRFLAAKMPSVYLGICGIAVGLVGVTAFYAGAVYVIASVLYLVVGVRIPASLVKSYTEDAEAASPRPSEDYLRGFREGVGHIEVPCRVCGYAIQIDTRSGRANEIVLESFRRFRHGVCPAPPSSVSMTGKQPSQPT